MATFYHFDTVTNFVREQECFDMLKVTKVEDLAPASVDGYYLTFNLKLDDTSKKYKGKLLRVLLASNYLDYYDLEFTKESLTVFFNGALGY